MKACIGLGNPGQKYAKTRHNIGFLVMDALAKKTSANWKTKERWEAEVTEINHNNKRLFLVKPITFMNLSGRSVKKFAKDNNLETTDFLVVVDDVDLPFGSIRFREFGSSGGQKGLSSIIEHFKEQPIARLRIGIGRPEHTEYPLEDWVLGIWSNFEETQLPKIIDEAIEIILEKLEQES